MNKLRPLLIALLLPLLAAVGAQGEVSANAIPGKLLTDDEIKATLQDCIVTDHWGVGLVVGIVDTHGPRVLSYGKLDHGDSAEVNGDTLFEIGSITKTFTVLLLEDMIQRGEMKLEDPVAKFLPASAKMPSRDGRNITLLDLATHTSGLPRDLNDWSIPAMYQFLSHCRLLSQPGSKVLYSNLGMALLAHAIELKAGTNYEALVQQRICQPLGMASTCIQPTPELRPRWSKSHGQENRTVWDFDAFCGPLVGAGAIRSTANDLLKYAAAEMGLTPSPLTPLMEKTHALQIPHAFGDADLALPWWIYHWDGEELITHGGNTGGQTAFLGIDKKLRRGVVVLANRNDAHDQEVRPLGFSLLCPSPTKPVAVEVAPEILDRYVGLYECTDVPLGIVVVRHDSDRLKTYLLNSARSDWLPQSKNEFALDQGRCHMKFNRSLTGQTEVVFRFQNRVYARARKVSNDAPDSLLQPMLQPLAAGECTPRPGSDLQGVWAGTLRLWFWPFQVHRGRVSIAEPSPGVYRAEFDYPEQNEQQLPLSVIYHPPDVEFVIRSGEAMFQGKLNRTHTKISGRVIQDGRSVSVTLRRSDPKPVSAKAAPQVRKN